MTERNKAMQALDDSELEGLFQAARDTAPMPGADLLARVLADGEAMQPPPPAASEPARAVRRGRGAPGPVRALLAAIGGWTAVAGLATAALAGIWIGYAHPDLAPQWAVPLAGGSDVTWELSDFEPRFDDFTPMMEGS